MNKEVEDRLNRLNILINYLPDTGEDNPHIKEALENIHNAIGFLAIDLQNLQAFCKNEFRLREPDLR